MVVVASCHAAEDFRGWFLQAYALSQMEGWAQENSDLRPLIHPNFTKHMAIELEASIAGQDQLVTTYALAQRWLRRFTTGG